MLINKLHINRKFLYLGVLITFIIQFMKNIYAGNVNKFHSISTIALPNTLIALPKGYDIKLKWIVPPALGNSAFSGNYLKKVDDIRFFIDNDSHCWITIDRKRIFAPTKNIGFELSESINDFIPVKSGGFLLSNIRSLGIPVFTKLQNYLQDKSNINSELFIAKLPEVEFQPFVHLPSIGSKLYVSSNGEKLFCLSEEIRDQNNTKIYNIYSLEFVSGNGINTKIWYWKKFLESELPIKCITANQEKLYYVIDNTVFVYDFYSKSSEKLVQANYEIRQLVITKYGLFCTTKDMIGYLKNGGQIYFIKTPYPFICSSFEGKSLFVLFTNTLGVAEIIDLSIFPKLLDHS